MKGNKKRRGSKVSLRAYPWFQAFALPLEKDKQRKACPRRVIYIHYGLNISILHKRIKCTTNGYTLFIYIIGLTGVGI